MTYDCNMTQVLTISCKLKLSASQAAKLDAFAQALLAPAGRRPYWVNENTPEKIVNAVKLQSLCYREIRTRFGLSSNLAQQVRPRGPWLACQLQGYQKPAPYRLAVGAG